MRAHPILAALGLSAIVFVGTYQVVGMLVREPARHPDEVAAEKARDAADLAITVLPVGAKPLGWPMPVAE